MLNKIKAIEYLLKENFQVEKSEKFIEFDEETVFLNNYSSKISVVLKEYQKFQEEKIIEDVVKTRAFLRNLDINIWNTYYLILLDNELNYFEDVKKYYSIEKNSKGIRKYLLVNNNDFIRMPFLEKKTSLSKETLDFKKSIHELTVSKDEDINNLIEWIFDNNGEFDTIKRNILKGKVKEIFIGDVIK